MPTDPLACAGVADPLDWRATALAITIAALVGVARGTYAASGGN